MDHFPQIISELKKSINTCYKTGQNFKH